MKKVERFVFIFFMILGLFFLGLGIFFLIKETDKKDRIYTTAIIEDIDGDNKVTVSYDVDGTSYTRPLNFYTSSYYEGKKIKVYYTKNNPSKVDVDASIFLPYMFIGMGSLFFIIGLIPIMIILLKDKKKKQLIMNGTIINARFKEIVQNTMYSVNGMHPYNIICECEYNGETCIFKSENIWIDPYNIINQKHIEYFKVYINPDNIKKYYVDISELEI